MRLQARNANLPPHTFLVTRTELEEWNGWFQLPSEEELILYANNRSHKPGSRR